MDEDRYPCEVTLEEDITIIDGDVCGQPSEVLEYDSDEDFYLMLCEAGHRWAWTCDDEVWK